MIDAYLALSKEERGMPDILEKAIEDAAREAFNNGVALKKKVLKTNIKEFGFKKAVVQAIAELGGLTYAQSSRACFEGWYERWNAEGWQERSTGVVE